jgi:formylglycine-generating enzyme required for sulfatase activity
MAARGMTAFLSAREQPKVICKVVGKLVFAATVALAGTAAAQDDGGRSTGDRWRDCDGCPEMVAIPAGTFSMGSPASEAGRYDREGPVHEVTISRPFAIGVYEVTRDEYSRFVHATSHSSGDDSCLVNEGDHWEERAGQDWLNLEFPQTLRHPVVCISWNDAAAYVAWLSQRTGMDYRLPSAAEWEYAARAGTSAPWYWGQSTEMQCLYANGADLATDFPWRTLCDDGHARTSLVGSYQANAFGLHDVIGNSWEWVQVCFNWSYEGAPASGDPWLDGDCSSRVMRGASWASTPKYLRAAHRAGERATFRSDYTGFRVARSL